MLYFVSQFIIYTWTPFISLFKSFQDWLLPSKQHWRNYHRHAPVPPSASVTASKLQDLKLAVTTWYDSKTYSVTVPHWYYSITKYCVITPLKPRQCPAAPHKYTEVYSSSAWVHFCTTWVYSMVCKIVNECRITNIICWHKKYSVHLHYH